MCKSLIQSIGHLLEYSTHNSFLYKVVRLVSFQIIDCCLIVVYIQFVRNERATGANLAKQMDWELSAGLSPDYLP